MLASEVSPGTLEQAASETSPQKQLCAGHGCRNVLILPGSQPPPSWSSGLVFAAVAATDIEVSPCLLSLQFSESEILWLGLVILL